MTCIKRLLAYLHDWLNPPCCGADRWKQCCGRYSESGLWGQRLERLRRLL